MTKPTGASASYLQINRLLRQLQLQARTFKAEPVVSLRDVEVGAVCGIVASATLGGIEHAMGALDGGMEHVVLFGAASMLAMQARLHLRRRRAEKARVAAVDEAARDYPAAPQNKHPCVDEGFARGLAREFGMAFPSGGAHYSESVAARNPGGVPIERVLVLDLRGWVPWALTIRSRDPHATKAVVALATDSEDNIRCGWPVVWHGCVGDAPVVGATFFGPQEHVVRLPPLPTLRPRIQYYGLLRIRVEVPPHSVVEVCATLTREPGDHEDPSWSVVPLAGDGEAA